MHENRLFIEQQAVEDNLYTTLQEKTLEEIQRLSGEVWTDFNRSDPGVTTADIANYILAEFDYKLGFDLHDYLTDEKSQLIPEKYGLFLPERVYPTTPITENDYRKLLLSEFPNLTKINLACDIETGSYDIKVELSPFEKCPTEIEDSIKKCFNSHRNLCEKLNTVTVYTPPLLFFHSEFEIHQGEDATSILANVYCEIMKYLSGSIRVEDSEDRMLNETLPEKWLDGVSINTRVIIPEQEDTEYELYKILLRVKGIKSFKTCYIIEIEDGNEIIKTDFKKGYRLYVPQHQSEFKVKVRIDNSLMQIDKNRFNEELQALYFSKNTFQTGNRKLKQENTFFSERFIPKGTYRKVFDHHPMANDFPKCYEMYIKEQFGCYLKLFDILVQRGLSELNGLKKLCSIEKNEIHSSQLEVFGFTEDLKLKNKDSSRNITAVKNRYMDFLDHLYGVDSNPVWMTEFSFYGEAKNDTIERRARFLRNAPFLSQTRSKARDLYKGLNIDNISTIKSYLSCLLDLNMNEAVSVGNILPSHNLILLENGSEHKQLRDKFNSMLINERMLDAANIDMVRANKPPVNQQDKLIDYQDIRQNLPIFNSNLISSDLFRWGISIENYKLVQQVGAETLLAFWNPEDDTWMNLGRSSDKQKLNEWANTLSRYLTELNRECEVVYVVEHNLLCPASPFTVSFVFSGWTTRFRSIRLREICHQLIKSLLPAHISAHIYWLGVSEMQSFEDSYRKWSKALSEDCPQGELEIVQQGILDVLEMKDKK